MSKVSRVDQRLAAALHLRQVESLIDSDSISASSERIFDKAGRNILDLVTDSAAQQTKFTGIELILGRAIADAKKATREQLETHAQRSYRTASKAMIDSIPWNWLAAKIAPEEAAAFEAMHWPDPPAYLNFDAGILSIDPVAITEEEKGDWKFSKPIDALTKTKLTKKQKEELAEKLLFPPPPLERIKEILFGGNWEERFDSLSKLITDKRAAMAELITGYADGEGIQKLKKRLEPLVGGIKSAAQRIARTEGMRVAENMQRESWGPLGDMMVGVQIIAVLDERTRPEHATRNGTIFYRQPTGQQKSMAELPDLPDEPNCRCMTSPVLSPPAELADDPELQRALGAEPAGTPEPSVYSDWFKSADPGRRKLVVGVRRYNEMQNHLASQASERDLEWSDFINQDGHLLPVDQLLAESPLQRQSRKDEIDRLLKLRGQAIDDIRRKGFEG